MEGILSLDRTWVNIDLDALSHNVKLLRKYLRPSVQIMAVVKADAYGHGASEIAKSLVESGVERLAVSTIDEGIYLRKLGIKVPILLLSVTQVARAEDIIEYDLTASIYDWPLLLALSQIAEQKKIIAKVHIKLDTGMGRIGFSSNYDAIRTIQEMMKCPYLSFEGIFTHFSSADQEDDSSVKLQFKKFTDIIQELDRLGINIPLQHCCNSAATLAFPTYHMDCVRPGLLLYGYNPFSEKHPYFTEFAKIGFKPVMQMYSKIIQIKKLIEDTNLGYGGKGKGRVGEWIATLPVGYADGLPKKLSGLLKMRVGQNLWQQEGSICMDACLLKFSQSKNKHLTKIEELPPAKVGDVVCLFGEDWSIYGKEWAKPYDTLLKWAEYADTIVYELLTNIGSRVPRVYLSNKKIVKTKYYILQETKND